MNSTGSFKVGVVSLVDLEKSDMIQSIRKKYEEKFKKEIGPLQQERQKLLSQIEQKYKQYERDQATMSEASKEALKKEVTTLGQKAQNLVMQTQQAMAVIRNKQMEEEIKKIKIAITKPAKSKNLDLVLPKKGLLYLKDPIDITKDVSKELK